MIEKIIFGADTTNLVYDIVSARISSSHGVGVSTAIVTCQGHEATINQLATLSFIVNRTVPPYSISESVFTGYVKQITRKIPEDTYTVVFNDVMSRATDYFIASTNPEAPLEYSNISAENLVKNIFEVAKLTDGNYDGTYFTFGINNPVQVNLVTAYDFNFSIANLLAYNIYADVNGYVNFKNRLPYLMGTDSPNRTVANSEILESEYVITEQDLRNRVVVYGGGSIYAEAKTSSPYLPTDFYKTTVYASPYIIQSQSMAQDIADYNLSVLNKLTYKLTLTILGRPDIMARDVVSVTDNKQGFIDEPFYVFAAEHNYSRSGYITTLELRK